MFVQEPNKQVKIAFVLDTPTLPDDLAKTAISSKRDRQLLEAIFDMLGLKEEDYYITYALKCSTPTKGLGVAEAKMCVNAYLGAELSIVNPRIVVTLGEYAMNVLTGLKGITKQRGEVVDALPSITNVKVLPTYGLAYTSYNDKAVEDFAKDIEKAYSYCLGIKKEVKTTQIVLCDTLDKIEDVIEYIQETKVVAFDFETTEIDDKVGLYADPNFTATCLSLSFQAGSSYVIPLNHFESPYTDKQQRGILRVLASEIFCNAEIKKIAHNAKFDMHVWNRLGMPKMTGKIYDTMLMHHLIDEVSPHGLKPISADLFPDTKDYEKEIKAYKWHLIPMRLLAPYAGTDTDLTFRIEAYFETILMESPELYNIFRNLTCPALKALFDAEVNGMLLDRTYLESNIIKARQILLDMEEELNDIPTVKKYVQAKTKEAKDEALNVLHDKIQALKDKSAESLKSKRLVLEEQLEKLTEADILKGKETTIKAKIAKLELETADKLKANTLKYLDKITAITTGIERCYTGLNFASSSQLSELLYTSRGFGFNRPKGEEGTATGESVIKQLQDTTGFVPLLMAYRSVAKTLGTYMVGMEKLTDSNNLVHTTYSLSGTSTGRLASKAPNLQNVPRGSTLKDERVVEVVGSIKKMFITRPDHYLVQVDYSQAELRLAAFFSKETVMLRAYADGKDLHTLTAMSASNLTEEDFYGLPKEKQKELRTGAKAGNFGLLYGMGWKGFKDYARDTYGVTYTDKEAQAYRDAFFNTYPNLLVWHENYRQLAKKDGYVTTLFGRRRHLTNIYSADEFKRAEDERAAINSPIQGTAGEFTVFAIALLRNRLPLEVSLVNTVHDSIIFQIPKNMMDIAIPIIKETCENLPIEKYFGVSLGDMSMKVDVEYSETNWKELKPYE